MQTISNTYKNYLENTLSLAPKSKIVVGDKEYLSDVIMSTPKITHVTSSFIGGFPSKTCSFELYNPNNDINLENKEIEVYKIVQTGEIKNLLNLEEYTFRGESNKSTIDFVSENKVVITSVENPTTWQNRAIVLNLPDGTYSFYVGKCNSTNSGVTDAWKNGGISINKYVNGVRSTFVSLQAGKSTPFVIENGEGIEYTINFYLSFGTAITGINTVTYDEMYMAREDTFSGYIPYNTIEYIKQGVFIPQASNITNDITARKLKITNVQDRTQLLDEVYESKLDWTISHTGLEIVQEICTRKGLTLETTDFNFASYVFKTRPNFSNSITDREVISRIAQIGGEIAIFNNEGNIVIKSSTPTGHTFSRKRYEKLSHEKPFIVNTVVLGKEEIDDDIIYQDTELMAKPYGKNLYKFDDLENYTYTNSSTEITQIENGIRTTGIMTGTFKYISFPIGGSEMLGKTYTLSGVITPSSANVGAIIVYFIRDDGYPVSSIATLKNSGGSITFTIPNEFLGTSTKVGLLFYSNQNGTMEIGDYVDYTNVQLEKGNVKTDFENYIETGVKEIKINDNPFTDFIREEIIENVASFIIGKSIIPFNVLNIVDGFYLELNDTITIIDKDNNSIEATILNYDTSNRIKSNIKAEITTSISNYNLAGSNKKSINDVKLEVDHLSNEIRSIVSKGYVNEEDLEVLRQSLVTQNEESITMTFTTLTEIMNSASAETQKQFQEQSKYIRFDGGISLGEVNNEVTLRIENETIYFSVSDVKIMEITPNGINIEKVITKEIDMGDFSLIIEDDDSLSLV